MVAEMNRRNNVIENTCRSYDEILYRRIGRVSVNTKKAHRKNQIAGFFLTGFVMIVLVLAFSFFILSPVEASEKNRKVKDYICVEVEEGDSLWSIAKQYGVSGKKEINAFIKEVKEINSMQEDTVIKPGNYLMIPCYKIVEK